MLPAVLALPLLFSLQAPHDSVRRVIEGHVLDRDGVPLADAEVLWPAGKLSVLSRADGGFTLVVPSREQVVILIRRVGYNPQALRVDLRDEGWRGSILMTKGAYRLPDVEVEARYAKPARYAATNKYDDFFRRQKMGIGTFISREQIERSNATHTLEILRGIPGVYVNIGVPGDVTTADIRMPRCQSDDHRLGKVTVWVDGARMIEPMFPEKGRYGPGSTTLAELLERIGPSGIEMIEVFRGPSQIPGEFHWDGCAAIAIWTRWNPGPDNPRRP